MLTGLEIDDLKHRWGNCFVALPETNEVGLFLGLESPKVEKAYLSIGGVDVWRDTASIDFKVPQNQYVNIFFNKEMQGAYIFKTGARFYKKGFSLSSHGGNGSKMFDATSPLSGKVRALNCLDENSLFFIPDARVGLSSRLVNALSISKNANLHAFVAQRLLLNNDSFDKIKSVLELVTNNKTLGLAISPQFFIGLSSHEDYDAELYCGLIPIGFIKAKTKTIFVNGPIAQEVSDFLISSGQTEYEIISV